jgi:hypothetical protein
MAALVKKIIFWNYGRNSWQYDVLCALILAFIFLTPKSWFTSELAPADGHQTPLAAKTLLLAWPDATNPPNTQALERLAQQATGRQSVRVRGALRPVKNETGTVVAYQVDIE